MDCIECKTTNPEGNRFCGQCGAELGRSFAETVRKNGLRDRQVIELEIIESVVGRLMRWAGWVGGTAALIVALFALLLGKSYLDVRTAVETGKGEIETAVREGKKDIDVVRETTTGLKGQVEQLQSDIDRYKQVNSDIGKLQKQLNAVQGQVVDLGKRELRVSTLTTTGPGPGQISFSEIGCSPYGPMGSKVTYCAQGSPPSLFQLTSTGDLRPVASRSPVGFQDVSVGPKSTCAPASRGTFYVEKGTGKAGDKPFLCVKKLDNTYDWLQLGTTP